MADEPVKKKAKAKKKSTAKRKAATKKKAASKKSGGAKKPPAAPKVRAVPVKKRVVLDAEDLEFDDESTDNAASESAVELDKAREAKTQSAPARTGGGALRSASVIQDAITARATSRVRNRDVTAFLRQLIMMLNAGTPILKSLNTLAHRGDHQGIREMVGGIAEYVGAGHPLWQAFARESKYFSPVDVHLIKAGEATGNLTEILERIVLYREKRDRLNRFVRNALIYPVILVTAALLVMILLTVFVIPVMREFFNAMDVEIPPFASFVMGTSDLVARFWWLGVFAVVGAIVAYKFWVRTPEGRLTADRAKYRIPLLGGLVKKRTIAEFSRTFSLLLRSGVSMMATLELCRNTVRNRAFVPVIQDMRDSVESGEGLEAPLRAGERDGFIPGVVVDMMLTGEDSGSLDEVAEQVADIYDEEVESAANGLKEAMVPLLVLVLGVAVGAIIISMFQPLVSLIEGISAGGV